MAHDTIRDKDEATARLQAFTVEMEALLQKYDFHSSAISATYLTGIKDGLHETRFTSRTTGCLSCILLTITKLIQSLSQDQVKLFFRMLLLELAALPGMPSTPEHAAATKMLEDMKVDSKWKN